MGSRKLPKMVREISAPASRLASTWTVATGGIGWSMVICADAICAENESKKKVRTSRARQRSLNVIRNPGGKEMRPPKSIIIENESVFIGLFEDFARLSAACDAHDE